jgi:hypothetical protein
MGMRTGEIVRESISNWYIENEMEEPLWYVDPDPPWWKEYLNELGIEKND